MQMPTTRASLPAHESFACRRALKLGAILATLAILGAPNATNPSAWALASSSAPFDDAEAQLRVRQAAGAAVAAARMVNELRQALEVERKHAVLAGEDRDLNQETIKALEKQLRDAETRQRELETALKEVQEARSRSLAAQRQRQKLEDTQHRDAENAKPATAPSQQAGQLDAAGRQQIQKLEAERDSLKATYDRLLQLYSAVAG